MSKQDYRIFEGLRMATCFTFISGYVNAYTFVVLDGRFAGVQSGNLLSLAYYLALGEFRKAISFTIPILFFIVGQFFTYIAKKICLQKGFPWHFGSSLVMLFLVLLTFLMSFVFSPSFLMASLALLASIQVETFRRLRGASYANVMMTGNIKHAAYLWFKGMMENNKELQLIARNITISILGFMVGVGLATILSLSLHHFALLGLVFPILYVNVQLWREKKQSGLLR